MVHLIISTFIVLFQKKQLFRVLLMFISTVSSFAFTGQPQQNNNVTGNTTLKVYLDCSDCDFAYFRKNLSYIDFVRDPKISDVHILVTEQGTASGGRSYGLNFIGLKAWSDLHFKLNCVIPPQNTKLHTWMCLQKTIEMGLMPYLVNTPVRENISIKFKSGAIGITPEQSGNDSWDHWVFKLKIGSDLEMEKSQEEYAFSGSVDIDRITDHFKLRFDFDYDWDMKKFTGNDQYIKSFREEIYSDIEFIYSLNPRWSAGFFIAAQSTTYKNIDFSGTIGPAIEYNIFPWDESDRRVFTLGYYLKSNYFDYTQTTIYNKTREYRALESLKLALTLRQPWGEVDANLEGSHYFHDFSKNRLTLGSQVSFNVIKGLSLNMQMKATLIHDQLYIPAGDISLEALLLKQQKLQTNFDFSTGFGITYTFGSIYNNIVNTRL
ncbi:MAG: hypothetical protein R6W78_14120 [Bacteroidales bacterium]